MSSLYDCRDCGERLDKCECNLEGVDDPLHPNYKNANNILLLKKKDTCLNDIVISEFVRQKHREKFGLDGAHDNNKQIHDWWINEGMRSVEVTAVNPSTGEKNIVGTSYNHLAIDTVARSKANHTPEQQKAICQFMIDKYSHREKNQDADDIVKMRFYTDWLEEIVLEKTNEQ